MQKTFSIANNAPYKYWAFISYSSKDKAHARWLIKKIETYRIPSNLVGLKTSYGQIPTRIYPLFRDRDELRVASNLGEELDKALVASKFLIIICSPNSANPSSWVNKEIIRFKTLSNKANIIALIVAGEPNASKNGSPEIECFPKALRRVVDENGIVTSEHTEPLAADINHDGDTPRESKRKALLKIIARIIEVDFDTLETRDKKRRQKQLLSVAFIAFSILLAASFLLNRWYIESLDNVATSMARESKLLIAKDPELAALLSIRSYQLSPNAFVYDSLISASIGNPNFDSIVYRGKNVITVATNKDDKIIAVADCVNADCSSQHVSLIDIKNIAKIGTVLEITDKKIKKMVFHPTLPRLYLVTDIGKSDVVSFYTHNENGINKKETKVWAYKNRVSEFKFSKNAKWLISFETWSDVYHFTKTILYNQEDKPICVRETKLKIKENILSDNGKYLALIFDDDSSELMSVDNKKNKSSILCDSPLPKYPFNNLRVGALAFGTDEDSLYSIELDGTTYHFNLNSPKQYREAHPVGYSLTDFNHRMSSNAKYTASISKNVIYVVDIKKYFHLQKILREEEERGSPYSYITERELKQSKPMIMALPRGKLEQFDFSYKNQFIYMISNNGEVVLWSTESKKLAIRNNTIGISFNENTETDIDENDNNIQATKLHRNIIATANTKLIGCGGDKKHDCLLVTNVDISNMDSGKPIKQIKFQERMGPIWDLDGTTRSLNVDFESIINRVCRMAGDKTRMPETEKYLNGIVASIHTIMSNDSSICE